MKRKKGKVFLVLVCYTLFSMFLCYYLRFGIVLFLIMLAGGMFLIWMELRWRDKSKREEELFFTRMDYLEQLICSYKRYQILSLALKESTETTGLSGALKKVEEGEEKKAFLWIEEKMGNDRMRWIHNFLLEAQTLGGDIEDSLDLMLMEVQQIKERVTFHEKKRQSKMREYGICLLLSGFLLLFSRALLPETILTQMVAGKMYKLMAAGILVLYFLVTKAILKKKIGSWREDFRYEKQKTQVKKNFSTWLLYVCLNLRHKSVYQAMACAGQESLKHRTAELLEAVYEEPAAIKPYMDFADSLGFREAKTGMRLLYAVREQDYGHLEKQILSLVAYNNRLMEDTWNQGSKRELAFLSFARNLPFALAGVKIGVDMIWYILIMMEQFSLFV